MEWVLNFVDDEGEEYERRGEADSPRKAERAILAAIRDIEEDIAAEAAELNN